MPVKNQLQGMLAVFEPLDRETLNEYFYHQMNNFSVIS
jgi:hypothetical protein